MRQSGKTPAQAVVKLAMLDSDFVAECVAFLEEEIRPHLQADVSRYARGRQRVWMGIQPPLDTEQNHSGPFVAGHESRTFWDMLTVIFEETTVRTSRFADWFPETALVSVGGNIAAHRDATYADAWSLGINFGACRWSIASERDGARPDFHMNLVGGEVFMFNAKHVHAVSEAAPDRWAVNAWRFATGPRAQEWDIPGRLAAFRAQG